MAIGKVESIDPTNSQYGTVSESETGDIYKYNDPKFSQKGLSVGSFCTFTIDYTSPDPVATELEAYTPTERTINTVVTGPIATTIGETLRVGKGGVVKGNISVTGNSSLFVEDTGSVEGEITVDTGSNTTVRRGGVVKGNISVTGGGALRIVNKGVVKGNINYKQGNVLIIGNDNGGGVVTGSITTDRIRKLSITATSTINCGA